MKTNNVETIKKETNKQKLNNSNIDECAMFITQLISETNNLALSILDLSTIYTSLKTKLGEVYEEEVAE